MVLLNCENIASDVRFAIWKVDESEEELLSVYRHLSFLKDELVNIKNEQRRLEKITIYILLYLLTEDIGIRIRYGINGEPLVEGYHIGISHTKGFSCVIISKNISVSIDIEYRNERVNRVVKRFIRNDEIAVTTIERLIFWSAKECFYKYIATSSLQPFDIRISRNNGRIFAEDLTTSMVKEVYCLENNDFILTYTY